VKPLAKLSISLPGLIVSLLAAFFFLYEFFLRTFVGSVSHQVIPDLHLNAETYALLGSAYFFAYGSMQIFVGMLTDKFGVKRIMLFAIMVCVLATYLFSIATDFNSGLLSRFLMGFGSSFAFICLLTVVMNWLPKKYFGFFAGMSQLIGTVGPLLAGGPLIAYLASSHLNWREALVKVAMIGVVLAVTIFIVMKDKRIEVSEEKSHALRPMKVRLKKLFATSQAWYIALYSAAVYFSIALLGAIWGTEYLQARGLSQEVAAEMVSLAWLGYAVGCPLVWAFSDLSKRRSPMLMYCSLVGVAVTACIS
jgi:MFS family permease